MKIIAIILVAFLPITTFAATISGEARIKTVKITTKSSTPIVATGSVTIKIVSKYISGPRGTCYYTQKNKKTGKILKKYVDKKFCKR